MIRVEIKYFEISYKICIKNNIYIYIYIPRDEYGLGAFCHPQPRVCPYKIEPCHCHWQCRLFNWRTYHYYRRAKTLNLLWTRTNVPTHEHIFLRLVPISKHYVILYGNSLPLTRFGRIIFPSTIWQVNRPFTCTFSHMIYLMNHVTF